MYVVAMVNTYPCFGITRKSIHIYAKKSSNKEKMAEYCREIKGKYPYNKVILTTEEKAKEVQQKYKDFYDEKERIALGEKPRISVEDLDKRLDAVYTKHLAIEACGRR